MEGEEALGPSDTKHDWWMWPAGFRLFHRQEGVSHFLLEGEEDLWLFRPLFSKFPFSVPALRSIAVPSLLSEAGQPQNLSALERRPSCPKFCYSSPPALAFLLLISRLPCLEICPGVLVWPLPNPALLSWFLTLDSPPCSALVVGPPGHPLHGCPGSSCI